MRRLSLTIALSLLLLPGLCWAGKGDWLKITNKAGKGGDILFTAKVGNKTVYGRTESPEVISRFGYDVTSGKFAIHLTKDPGKLNTARRASEKQSRAFLKALSGMKQTDDVRTLKGFVKTDVLGD